MHSVLGRYTSSNEEEVAALLEGLGQGFYSVDREWRIVRFNQLAAAHFNRRRADMVGRVLWDAFPLTTGTSMGKRFFAAMASRQPVNDEAASVIAAKRILSYRLFPVGAGLGIVWHEVQPPLRSLDPALDALPFGIVRLFENMQVAAANPAARRIFDAGDGLCLGSTVTAFHKSDNTRLQQAMGRAIARQGASADVRLSIKRRSGRRSYLVRVFFHEQSASSTVLTIVDPEAAPTFKEEELVELFGLTRAEARVVGMLASSGTSLPQIADRLGIAFETARTHLARARAKTSTSSQIDLVRLLAGSLYV